MRKCGCNLRGRSAKKLTNVRGRRTSEKILSRCGDLLGHTLKLGVKHGQYFVERTPARDDPYSKKERRNYNKKSDAVFVFEKSCEKYGL